jgi:hypothetical protein
MDRDRDRDMGRDIEMDMDTGGMDSGRDRDVVVITPALSDHQANFEIGV